MKKAYRVKKEKEFQRVFHHGQSVANRQLVLYTYPKPDQAHFRVGLSVGKKIGNAVTRNRIKRYLRQALQELEPRIQSDIDFLLIARKDILTKSYPEIVRSIVHVMRLGGIIQPSSMNTVPGGMNEQNKS